MVFRLDPDPGEILAYFVFVPEFASNLCGYRLTRPRIIALTLDPPCMPGSGGEVRSYFFIKMLAGVGDLTLISLGGASGHRKVGKDISSLCRTIIEPDESWQRVVGKRPSRLHAWLRGLTVIAFPWRNGWRDFHYYCMQYIQEGSREGEPLFQWRKRILKSALRFQFRMGARFGNMPCGLEFAYADKFEAIKQSAVNELAKGNYDLIWYEHTHSYAFVNYLIGTIPYHRRPKLACNAHNVEWLLYQRVSQVSSEKWGSEYAQIQSRILKTMENEQFRRCDLVVVCSKEDKQAGAELAPDTNFVVVGNGVDVTYFCPGSSDFKASAPTLLFTGTFGYQPNRDGLHYFLKQVFPLIRAKVPECHFVFAGYDAQSVYDDMGLKDEFVRCVSSPADMRPCFREAWIFVVPLRSGGGTRLKILEAMAMEVPVVSTKIGAEGIQAEEGRHLLTADSSADFARQVIKLLKNPPLRVHLAQESSSFVRQQFDWQRLGLEAAGHVNALFAPKPLGYHPKPSAGIEGK